MNFRPEIAVSGRALVQKQQRILDVNGVGVEHFFEQLVGVVELRFELGPHFGAHRVAALADARPDRGPQIAGALPNWRRISPTPFSTTRAAVPRQPA